MPWEPAGHRILVRPDEPPEKIGSLYVASWIRDTRAIENILGTVAAVGMTAWKAFDEGKPWANIGDRVAFAKYGGFILEDEVTKEKLRVLNDEDIIAIWRKE